MSVLLVGIMMTEGRDDNENFMVLMDRLMDIISDITLYLMFLRFSVDSRGSFEVLLSMSSVFTSGI